MREIYSSVVFSLGIALCACAAAAPLPRCSSELAPTATVVPRLPPRLHNEFSGKAQVAFVIRPNGHVQSPVIVSAEWQPIGRSRGKPVGYNDATLSAVAEWRYPLREQACRHQVPVEFHFEGSSPTAGRSNNSFKPNPLRGSA